MLLFSLKVGHFNLAKTMFTSLKGLPSCFRSHLILKNVHFSTFTEQGDYIQKMKPPKKPENFKKLYPKKPLYWNTQGTSLYCLFLIFVLYFNYFVILRFA